MIFIYLFIVSLDFDFTTMHFCMQVLRACSIASLLFRVPYSKGKTGLYY